ncbi:MAG: 50S ribosomal protein L10 [Exilispira sp.]
MEKKREIRPEKAKHFNDIKSIFQENSFVLFCNFSKITVKQFEDLRSKIKEKNGNVKVIKTNIAKLAAREALEIALPEQMFILNTFIVYGNDDISSIVKEVKNLQKTKVVSIKGAIFENSFLDESMAEKLADLPTKIELYGMLANILASPYTRYTRALGEIIARLPRVINQIAQSK